MVIASSRARAIAAEANALLPQLVLRPPSVVFVRLLLRSPVWLKAHLVLLSTRLLFEVLHRVGKRKMSHCRYAGHSVSTIKCQLLSFAYVLCIRLMLGLLVVLQTMKPGTCEVSAACCPLMRCLVFTVRSVSGCS